MIALITNDDGIDADGIAALQKMAAPFFEELWVVAPSSQMSEIGHRVTTQSPIRFSRKADRVFAIEGTPADCTRIAMAHLMPRRPDWVLSGINHGGNLGRHDFVISGTVAAVREAAFAGIPGVAFSHFMKRGREPDWDAAGQWCGRAFREILDEHFDPGDLWTVNLPHPAKGDPEPRVIRCEQEKHPLQVVYEQVGENELVYAGDYHERPRRSGSDVAVCFGGDIALSKIRV